VILDDFPAAGVDEHEQREKGLHGGVAFTS
jgi:hypothetical protein